MRTVRLQSVDLNLLVSLEALLSERSVTKAAERMLVGQSAMSSTLGRLRSLFSDPLLVRVGRELALTPFAESLLVPLADVMSRAEALINTGAQFDPVNDSRTFTIVASDYIALILLRPLMERLQEVAPNVQLRLVPVADRNLEQLTRSQADLVIMPRELLPGRLELPHELLFEDSFVCIVDAKNPDVGETFTREHFRSLPYLLANQGSITSIVQQGLEVLGIARPPEMTAGSFVMAPLLLPGTRLYSIIQRRLATLLLGDGANLRILEPPVDLIHITETMVWTPRNDSDAAHIWLRREVSSLSSQLEH